MKVTVKYFYKEIEYVATIIWRLSVTDLLINAAKQQDFEGLNAILEGLKKHHPEFWQRMCELYYDYESEKWPTIFGRDDEYYNYDSSKIYPSSIICMCAISNMAMNVDNLFEDYMVFKIALQEEGYFELADYIEKYEFSELSDLVKAYKKE